MKSILVASIASLVAKLTFGALTFQGETSVVVDKCISLYNSGNSVIYRCSNDSIWEYTYTGTTMCMGEPSVDPWGGCNEGNNDVYLIERCAVAQQMAASGTCKYYADNSNVYPLDTCINGGSSSSYKFTCNGTDVYLQQWGIYSDCPSTQTPSSSNMTGSGTFSCTGNDCSASALLYDKSSNDFCNFESSNYGPPGGSTYEDTDCNYIAFNDASQPKAIGKCTSGMDGYYKYSSKYTCHEVSEGNWIVQAWQWLDNDDCSGDDYKYLVANYSMANHTIKCGGSDCGNVIRTYSYCEEDLDTHRPYYTEDTVVFDQCVKYYHDPNTVTDDKTFNQNQYYMYSCIGGYKGIYYFLDSECKDMDAFYVFNTSTADLTCPTVIEGCSNAAVHISGYLGVIISCFVVIMKLLW